MIIHIPSPPVITPVSRDIFAPWLKEKSHKVKLVKDWILWIDDKEFVVEAGYISDWSTIPSIMWMFYPPNYTEARQAALWHDYVYSHLWPLYPKSFADASFRQIMLDDGSSEITAAVFYRSTRWFGRGGWSHVKKRNAHPFWKNQYHELAKTL